MKSISYLIDFVVELGLILNVDRFFWAVSRYLSLVKLKRVNKKIGGKLNHLKSDAFIECSGGVKIGKFCHTAKGLTIFSTNHNWRSVEMIPYDSLSISKPVIIGDAVWLGANVTILPGVKIGDGAIVAAGSVVITNILEGELHGGNPARLIGTRDMSVFNELKMREKYN
jgi:acetyltransferase-like isoleucine patch superfamily enzyme